MRNGFVKETTPCAFKKDDTAMQMGVVTRKKRYWILTLNWAIKLLIWVQVVYGTMVLSSKIFLSLFMALEIAGRFLAGAVVCRIVLGFEMYGLQEVSKSHP